MRLCPALQDWAAVARHWQRLRRASQANSSPPNLTLHSRPRYDYNLHVKAYL